MEDRPQLLKVKEVADLLRISEQGTFRLCWSGALASVKVGRLRFVPREAVRDYLGRSMEAQQGGAK